MMYGNGNLQGSQMPAVVEPPKKERLRVKMSIEERSNLLVK